MGINLGAPELNNPETLISKIVAVWQQHVPPGGSWGPTKSKRLQAMDIAAWTHNPPHSWFSMMFLCLKEVGILQPQHLTSNQSAPSTPPQLLLMSPNVCRHT
ncbi:hypothetical protein RHS04_09721 [Rhizoctonia solani]|uniref:Uncharacterized protein n=1 Tax=Rhizoctonia solani TaxID=456999 RepID=A0A8H7GYR8_9AGAM|nr:hypothetical protein RHS04_09721 [Rhizoctonia solani]